MFTLCANLCLHSEAVIGSGLSYTNFSLEGGLGFARTPVTLNNANTSNRATFTATVTNTGKVAGTETVFGCVGSHISVDKCLPPLSAPREMPCCVMDMLSMRWPRCPHWWVWVRDCPRPCPHASVLRFFSPPAGSEHARPTDPARMALQRQLFDFEKVALAPGQSTTITLEIDVDTLVLIDAAGSRTSTPGTCVSEALPFALRF